MRRWRLMWLPGLLGVFLAAAAWPQDNGGAAPAPAPAPAPAQAPAPAPAQPPAAPSATPAQSPAAPSAAPAAPRTPWLFLGPRIGISGEISQPSDFNDTIQRFFPTGHSYFPVYSQIGVDLSERISLAQTGYHLFFSQLLTVSGLDQNFALPVFDLLLGAMTPFGLEAALGPQLELANDGSSTYLAPSMVYAVGWRFSISGLSLPVMLFVDPLPPTRRVRLTVLAGVDYGFVPPGPKPPSPFNY